MVNHDIVPGTTVRFRNDREHLGYRDRHGLDDIFVVTRVDSKYVWWFSTRVSRERSCYLRRVEPVDGPW